MPVNRLLHVQQNLLLRPGCPPEAEVLHVTPIVLVQGIASQHEHLALQGQQTEDAAHLLSTRGHLGAVDVESHQAPIVGGSQVHPLVGEVAAMCCNGGDFASTVRLQREEIAGVSVPLVTDGVNPQDPASVTGGVRTFVIQSYVPPKEKYE